MARLHESRGELLGALPFLGSVHVQEQDLGIAELEYIRPWNTPDADIIVEPDDMSLSTLKLRLDGRDAAHAVIRTERLDAPTPSALSRDDVVAGCFGQEPAQQSGGEEGPLPRDG